MKFPDKLENFELIIINKFEKKIKIILLIIKDNMK